MTIRELIDVDISEAIGALIGALVAGVVVSLIAMTVLIIWSL